MNASDKTVICGSRGFLRRGGGAIVATLFLCLATGAAAQGINFGGIKILTQKLAPNFSMLTGSPGVDPGHPEAAGGRIGVLAGPDGVFMVDATYAPLTDEVVAAIRKPSSAPIRFLVNTHSHPDHTGGNPNFARLRAVVLAREEVWQTMSQPLPPILGMRSGREWLYPRFQFDARLKPVRPFPEIKSILAALPPDTTHWDHLQWFLDPNLRLNGKTPLDVWHLNREKVVQAAQKGPSDDRD